VEQQQQQHSDNTNEPKVLEGCAVEPSSELILADYLNSFFKKKPYLSTQTAEEEGEQQQQQQAAQKIPIWVIIIIVYTETSKYTTSNKFKY
jgi:hypothetical protein